MTKFKVGDVVILNTNWLDSRQIIFETRWCDPSVVIDTQYNGTCYEMEIIEGYSKGEHFRVYHEYEDCLILVRTSKRKGFRYD
jgi:hypothetical protein